MEDDERERWASCGDKWQSPLNIEKSFTFHRLWHQPNLPTKQERCNLVDGKIVCYRLQICLQRPFDIAGIRIKDLEERLVHLHEWSRLGHE